jgi:hypothetical protein
MWERVRLNDVSPGGSNLPVASKRPNTDRRQGDDASRPTTLRLTEDELTIDLLQGAANLHGAGLKVNIGPGQSKGLTASQSGQQQEQPQCAQPVLLSGIEELSSLPTIERCDLGCISLGWADELGDITADQILAHSMLQSATQHGVDELAGTARERAASLPGFRSRVAISVRTSPGVSRLSFLVPMCGLM